MNMKKLVLVALSLLLCGLLLACKSSPEEAIGDLGQVEVAQIETLRDLIPDIDKIEELSIPAGYTSYEFNGGEVYALASQEEQNTVVGYLFDSKFNDLSEVEKSEILEAGEKDDGPSSIQLVGATYLVRIKTEQEIYDLTINNFEDVQYFSILYSNGEELFFKLAADTFPFQELAQYNSTIMSNDSDINNSGIVKMIGQEDSKGGVSKGASATVKNILDGTITTAAASDGDDSDIEYDFKFTMGEHVYLIDSQSGHFSRDIDGDTSYAQLEESWHERVLIWLRSGGPIE